MEVYKQIENRLFSFEQDGKDCVSYASWSEIIQGRLCNNIQTIEG